MKLGTRQFELIGNQFEGRLKEELAEGTVGVQFKEETHRERLTGNVI